MEAMKSLINFVPLISWSGSWNLLKRIQTTLKECFVSQLCNVSNMAGCWLDMIRDRANSCSFFGLFGSRRRIIDLPRVNYSTKGLHYFQSISKPINGHLNLFPFFKKWKLFERDEDFHIRYFSEHIFPKGWPSMKEQFPDDSCTLNDQQHDAPDLECVCV